MKRRVLIIDDNVHYASLLSLFLKDHAYRPKIVFDGLTALSLIAKEDFDLWIVDHWLFGDFKGIDFVRKAREQGFLTKAVIITCLIPSEVEQEIKGLGISPVMDKLLVGTPAFLGSLSRILDS